MPLGWCFLCVEFMIVWILFCGVVTYCWLLCFSGVLLICCYHWFGFALWVSGLTLLCGAIYCFVVGGLVVDLVFVV